VLKQGTVLISDVNSMCKQQAESQFNPAAVFVTMASCCVQGVILMLNPAAVQMFGYQKGELEGKNVSVLV